MAGKSIKMKARNGWAVLGRHTVTSSSTQVSSTTSPQAKQQDPQPTPIQLYGPICRSKAKFFRNGLEVLPTPCPEITPEQICPICLRCYSNDPSITTPRTSPTNSNTSSLHPAVKVTRCGHMFHRECLKDCLVATCPCCRTKLYRRGLWKAFKKVNGVFVRRILRPG